MSRMIMIWDLLCLVPFEKINNTTRYLTLKILHNSSFKVFSFQAFHSTQVLKCNLYSTPLVHTNYKNYIFIWVMTLMVLFLTTSCCKAWESGLMISVNTNTSSDSPLFWLVLHTCQYSLAKRQENMKNRLSPLQLKWPVLQKDKNIIFFMLML